MVGSDPRNRIDFSIPTFGTDSTQFGSGTRPELDDPTRRGQSNCTKRFKLIVHR